MHVLFFFFCDQDYIYIHIRKQKRLQQTTQLASSSHGILRCLCFQSRAASFTVDGRRPSQRTAVEHWTPPHCNISRSANWYRGGHGRLAMASRAPNNVAVALHFSIFGQVQSDQMRWMHAVGSSGPYADTSSCLKSKAFRNVRICTIPFSEIFKLALIGLSIHLLWNLSGYTTYIQLGFSLSSA